MLGPTPPSRKGAAADAGLSPWQAKEMLRGARLPFKPVKSDPATIKNEADGASSTRKNGGGELWHFNGMSH